MRYSFVVECLLMVRWVFGSNHHDGFIELVIVQPVLHHLCNKSCSMCLRVIKYPLLLIKKDGRKGFFKFNDALNTFCLRLYGVIAN